MLNPNSLELYNGRADGVTSARVYAELLRPKKISDGAWGNSPPCTQSEHELFPLLLISGEKIRTDLSVIFKSAKPARRYYLEDFVGRLIEGLFG